jgi:hypothetical protein
MIKITNVIVLGRFKNIKNNKSFTIRMAKALDSGADLIFYLYLGKRIYISENDFNHNYKKAEPLNINKLINKNKHQLILKKH